MPGSRLGSCPHSCKAHGGLASVLPFFSNTGRPLLAQEELHSCRRGWHVWCCRLPVPRVGGAVDPPWVSAGCGGGEDSRVDGQAAHQEPGGTW